MRELYINGVFSISAIIFFGTAKTKSDFSHAPLSSSPLSLRFKSQCIERSPASHAVYMLIQCTPLLVEKGDDNPDMTFRITKHKQEIVQVRDPLWIWNPWGRTHKVQKQEQSVAPQNGPWSNKFFLKKVGNVGILVLWRLCEQLWRHPASTPTSLYNWSWLNFPNFYASFSEKNDLKKDSVEKCSSHFFSFSCIQETIGLSIVLSLA